MFIKKTPSEKTELDAAISDLFAEMEDKDKDSVEYAKLVKQLSKLYTLKEIDHCVVTKNRVSPDVKLTVAANLIGILLIVGHERANVVTSKALNLLLKLR